MTDDLADEFLREADTNGDGKIDYAGMIIIDMFIFKLREYPCNITHDIFYLIYHGYF